MTSTWTVIFDQNMRTQSADTDSDAERIQIELLRKATISERFHLLRSLTQTTRRLAWQGIRRIHPEASDQEVDLIFVAVHYGQELADRLRADLARRRPSGHD